MNIHMELSTTALKMKRMPMHYFMFYGRLFCQTIVTLLKTKFLNFSFPEIFGTECQNDEQCTI